MNLFSPFFEKKYNQNCYMYCYQNIFKTYSCVKRCGGLIAGKKWLRDLFSCRFFLLHKKTVEGTFPAAPLKKRSSKVPFSFFLCSGEGRGICEAGFDGGAFLWVAPGGPYVGESIPTQCSRYHVMHVCFRLAWLRHAEIYRFLASLSPLWSHLPFPCCLACRTVCAL